MPQNFCFASALKFRNFATKNYYAVGLSLIFIVFLLCFIDMLKNRKKLLSAAMLGGFCIFGIAILFIVLSNKKVEIPEAFIKAREDAALVSKEIVKLTNETNEKIKEVNKMDLEGRRTASDTQKLIQEARTNNSQAYEQAFELTRHLQKLAESLSLISSETSQRLAYNALTVELALVSEFIIYTQSLNNFLDNLSRALVSNSFETRENVALSLREVNNSSAKINKLNNEFLAKMQKFDDSL